MQIQKILVRLICREPGLIKGHAGAELHGLFFKALENANIELAEAVHQMQYKPFIIGPLVGKINRRNGVAQVELGEIYSFSLTTLTAQTTSSLPLILEHIGQNKLVIGGAAFSFIEAKVLIDNNYTYFDFMSGSKPNSRITMEFVSPTCFRSSGQQLIFPEPGLVFGSLLDRWNFFSDLPLPKLDLSLINVTKYELKTTMVQFNNYNLIGFKGTCTFTLPSDTQEVIRWAINTLANFATVVGVGYKTTMGMGQVRLIK
jgi:CRISPR-associated endoribonuclease Cas6